MHYDMTKWFLYFLECQASPNKKHRFRDYDHFLEWILESFND